MGSIKKLSDEISFRLLATKNHPDYDWLVKRLRNNKYSLFLEIKDKKKEPNSFKRFITFFLIWYSQQMAIPFWVVGHVHLHFATWHDAYEYSLSIFLHLMVAVGFWIDWKQNGNTKYE